MFSARNTVALCVMHLSNTPEPITERSVRSVPAALEALVMQCLAKAPDERPSTAQLLTALEAFGAEPWGVWTNADAVAWWNTYGAALEAHRAETVSSMEPTMIGRVPSVA